MMMLRAILLFTAVVFAGAAGAAPRSIADCEAIQAANAYNQCLASFGPVRGGGRKYVGAASGPANGASSRHGRRDYSSTASFQRARSGRMRMELSPSR